MQRYTIATLVFFACVAVGTAYLAINAENLDEIDLIFVPISHPRWSEPPPEDIIAPEKKIITIPYYNCQENYEKYLNLFDAVNPTESIAAKSPIRVAIYELEEELMKNNCPQVSAP